MWKTVDEGVEPERKPRLMGAVNEAQTGGVSAAFKSINTGSLRGRRCAFAVADEVFTHPVKAKPVLEAKLPAVLAGAREYRARAEVHGVIRGD